MDFKRAPSHGVTRRQFGGEVAFSRDFCNVSAVTGWGGLCPVGAEGKRKSLEARSVSEGGPMLSRVTPLADASGYQELVPRLSLLAAGAMTSTRIVDLRTARWRIECPGRPKRAGAL